MERSSMQQLYIWNKYEGELMEMWVHGDHPREHLFANLYVSKLDTPIAPATS
jgi:hypothetical protein